MSAWLDRLVAQWNGENVGIREGVSAETLAAFERSHQIHLPADFAEYIRTVDGMNSNVHDDGLFSFFSLGEMTFWDNNLTFAHWAIESCIFTLNFGSNGECSGVLRFDGGEHRLAGTFSEFIDIYYSDPERLYTEK